MKMKHRITGEECYVVKCRGCWERVDSPLDYQQFQVFFTLLIFLNLILNNKRKWWMNMDKSNRNRSLWKGHISSQIGAMDRLQLARRNGMCSTKYCGFFVFLVVMHQSMTKDWSMPVFIAIPMDIGGNH